MLRIVKESEIDHLRITIRDLNRDLDILRDENRKMREFVSAHEEGAHGVGVHCEGCKHRYIRGMNYSKGSWVNVYACKLDVKCICSDFEEKEGR